MKPVKAGYLALMIIFVTVLLSLADYFGMIEIPAQVLLATRWISIGSLLIYGLFKKSLTAWILIAMVAGAEIGYDFPADAVKLQFLGKIFLKMIKTIVGPLLFATLVYGIAGHSDLKQVGRMGWKSILYFEIITTLALFVGLLAINVSKAGVGIEKPAEISEALPEVPDQDVYSIILHVFPENIAKSMADGEVLQIVVFSILFGIGLSMVREDKRKPMLLFTESLSEVMFKFTHIIMYFAPIGVGAAVAFTIGHMGLGILLNLLQLLATLYAALGVFLLGVLLPIAWMVGVPIRRFVQAIAEPVSIAFATTSSEAALPRAMEAMEKIGVPRKIVAFVMPTGYSFNLDGTTLYLSLAAVFVAQAAGVPLLFGQQMVMVFTLMLTSKGVAGVPRASLVILAGTAASFGLPEWPIACILGIDALMDMARTSVNVIGNCLATIVIAKWEGEYNPDIIPAASNDVILPVMEDRVGNE